MVLMSIEWVPSNQHRGFIASWPQFGVPVGLFTANLAVLASSALTGDQFLVWGWRSPVGLGRGSGGVRVYVRLGILETPVFARLSAARRIERAPVAEVFRRHPRDIALTALCRMGEQAPFYIFTAFVFAYGSDTLHIDRDFLLTAVLAASALSFVMIPRFGRVSDRLGRKRVYMAGAIVTGIYGFVYF